MTEETKPVAPEPCMWRSSNQLVGPQQIASVNVVCPKTTKNNIFTQQMGCKYFDEVKKKCKLDIIIDFACSMAENNIIKPSDN